MQGEMYRFHCMSAAEDVSFGWTYSRPIWNYLIFGDRHTFHHGVATTTRMFIVFAPSCFMMMRGNQKALSQNNVLTCKENEFKVKNSYTSQLSSPVGIFIVRILANRLIIILEEIAVLRSNCHYSKNHQSSFYPARKEPQPCFPLSTGAHPLCSTMFQS